MNLELLKYNGNPLMGEKSISILAYPPQFIFSEKYQAIVSLGSLNSRMKDYFDCYILISQNILDKEKVSDAIFKTFKNRQTKIQLIQDADEEMIRLWNSFQKKVPKFLIPLDQVIKEINNYLNKIGII